MTAVSGTTIAPVVVGTDLSESAGEALRQARAWADRVGAMVLVTHVVASRDEAVRAAVDASRLVREQGGPAGALRVNDSSIVAQGSPSEELVSVAESRGAQLLVVGASGKGAVERFVFGTTAEQCVRRAPCPVLVARPGDESGPVLAATDFSAGAAPAVSLAALEARRRKVPLTILYSVWDPPPPFSAVAPAVISGPAPSEEERRTREEVARQILATLLEREGVAGNIRIRHERPEEAIVQEAEDIGASLVVLGTHGRTGIARVALGSVAEAVARACRRSVLCVRLPQ